MFYKFIDIVQVNHINTKIVNKITSFAKLVVVPMNLKWKLKTKSRSIVNVIVIDNLQIKAQIQE